MANDFQRPIAVEVRVLNGVGVSVRYVLSLGWIGTCKQNEFSLDLVWTIRQEVVCIVMGECVAEAAYIVIADLATRAGFISSNH